MQKCKSVFPVGGGFAILAPNPRDLVLFYLHLQQKTIADMKKKKVISQIFENTVFNKGILIPVELLLARRPRREWMEHADDEAAWAEAAETEMRKA